MKNSKNKKQKISVLENNINLILHIYKVKLNFVRTLWLQTVAETTMLILSKLKIQKISIARLFKADETTWKCRGSECTNLLRKLWKLEFMKICRGYSSH